VRGGKFLVVGVRALSAFIVRSPDGATLFGSEIARGKRISPPAGLVPPLEERSRALFGG
jgi:hypothetical protein